jgi:hypothetical protein
MKIRTSRKLSAALTLFIALAGGCASREARISAAADAMARINFHYDKTNSVAKKIRAEDFSEQNLGAYSDDTLDKLWSALWMMSFYMPDNPVYAERMNAAFAEKIRRNHYNAKEALEVFTALATDGMFERAAALSTRLPDIHLPALPKITGSPDCGQKWRVYDVSENGDGAELKTLPPGEGFKLAVAVKPDCGNALGALKMIHENADLHKVFSEHSFIVTRRFYNHDVADMRRDFELPNIYIAYKSSDFKDIDLRTTPMFYILKNGKVIDKYDHWDEPGIRALLKKYNLL